MGELKQISIFAENKPGKLEKITKVLAEAGINILAVNIASTDGFGVIKFIVDKCELAFEKLKQSGFTVSLNEVLAVEMEDRPGGLYEVARILSKKGINLENAYVFIVESRERAFLIVEVKDIKRARELLQHENLRFYRGEEF